MSGIRLVSDKRTSGRRVCLSVSRSVGGGTGPSQLLCPAPSLNAHPRDLSRRTDERRDARRHRTMSPCESRNGRGSGTDPDSPARRTGRFRGFLNSPAEELQLEASVEQIRELNEQAIKAARAAGQRALDAYQAALESVVDAEKKLAEGSSSTGSPRWSPPRPNSPNAWAPSS